MEIENKTCVLCGEIKPITEFYRKGRGWQSRCIACDKEHGRKHRRTETGGYYVNQENQEQTQPENVQLFNNADFGDVRVIVENGEPLFCLADVCKILEIKNPSKAKTRLNENGCRVLNTLTTSEGTSDNHSVGGNPNMTFINEPNVYKLIFQSRKAEAQAFADWVTETILPSIRKNGAYVANQESLTPEEIIRRGYEAITRICEEQRQKLAQQEQQLQLQQPKVDYFDQLIERDQSLGLRVAGNELGIGQKAFIDYLIANKYVYRNVAGQILPYAPYIGEYFTLKEYSREQHSGVQTLVTAKGRAYFNRLLNK